LPKPLLPCNTMKYETSDDEAGSMLASGDNQADTTHIGSRRALKWVMGIAVLTMVVGLAGLAATGALQSAPANAADKAESMDAIVQEFLDDDNDKDDDDQGPPEFFEQTNEAEEAEVKLEVEGEEPAETRQLLSSRARAFLKWHNQVRCMHKVKYLKWSSALASGAQRWANRGRFAHSHGKYGENLAMGTYMGPKQAVKMWYAEIKHTRGGRVSGFSGGTGHYTQLVWKTTRFVGCGQHRGLVVCRYYPAGNMMGQFRRMVNGPKRSSRSCR